MHNTNNLVYEFNVVATEPVIERNAASNNIFNSIILSRLQLCYGNINGAQFFTIKMATRGMF